MSGGPQNDSSRRCSMNLKQRIRSGDDVLGLAVPVTMGRDDLAALMPTGPYDFVSVDSQHAPYDEERLTAFCKMTAEMDIPVQFRIKHTQHTYLVGNYLDLGPTGVEIPQVETEETVDEAVANFYYPHRGIRSWGGQTRVGLAERPDMHEYADWWAQTGVLSRSASRRTPTTRLRPWTTVSATSSSRCATLRSRSASGTTTRRCGRSTVTWA